MSLGERLKKLRGKKTQQEVADHIEISRARYSHYENGRSEPDTDILRKLSNYYGVSVDYLLTGINQLNMFEDKDLDSPKLFIFSTRLDELIKKEVINYDELLEKLDLTNKAFTEKYSPLLINELPNPKELEIILSTAAGYKDYLLGKKNEPPLPKEERDIAKRLATFMEELEQSDALAFDGEPMSYEAKESLLESMELLFRQTQRINKKYTPKKYRDNE